MATGLTPNYSLHYPLPTDPVDVAGDIELLAEDVDTVLLNKASLSSANTFTNTNIFNGAVSRGAPVTKTSSFTLGNAENWIVCNGTGTITVTLPAASSWIGREVMLKTIAAFTVVSASSNVVPINTASAGTAILAATAGKWATLVSNGTNWVVMQSN
jgi:hypothetical protein